MLHQDLWPRGHPLHRPLRDGGGGGGGPGSRGPCSGGGGGGGIGGNSHHLPHRLPHQVIEPRRYINYRAGRHGDILIAHRGCNGGRGVRDHLVEYRGRVKPGRQNFWIPFDTNRSHFHLIKFGRCGVEGQEDITKLEDFSLVLWRIFRFTFDFISCIQYILLYRIFILPILLKQLYSNN